MTPADIHVDTMLRWRRDAAAFTREHFGVKPDPWQLEVLDAFSSPDPDKVRISMQACVGPGKTAVESWCGWHFLATQGDRVEHPKGAAVSVTAENLRDNLWAELAKWQAQSPYLADTFTWSSTRITQNDYPETWFLSARNYPKTGSADEQGKTLSGLHSRYVLFLIDESGAIPPTVLRAADQGLSACAWGKILQAGNPISTEGCLYAASSTFRQLWYVVVVNGDPDDVRAWVNGARAMAQHSGASACLCPRCWSAQQIQAYGRDNPWVQSYILGRFPKGTFNTLLTVEEVEAAMHRHYAFEEYAYSQKRLGIDVARFGDDRSVIWPRRGLVNFKPIILRQARTTAIAGAAAVACKKWHDQDGVPVGQITIDDTGHWGHGVVDQLVDAQYPVIPVIYSEPATDKRYRNRRTEMWFAGADAIRNGAALVGVPPEFIAEATQVTYTFLGGQLALEPKEMLKKRLGRSPDLFDAYAQTHAFPDQPREVLRQLNAALAPHAKTEFDPYAADEPRQASAHALADFNPFA